jgi:hypothetical protein
MFAGVMTGIPINRRCGARLRNGGRRQQRPVQGRTRCRPHDGKSMGPTSAGGPASIGSGRGSAPHFMVVRSRSPQRSFSAVSRLDLSGDEMTEQTREAVDSYIGGTRKKPGEFLFSSRPGRDRPITKRQYAWLVGQWVAGIGLDRGSSERTHCAEPKRPSSTATLATCGQYSSCWGIRRSRARCATSGLRSTTLLP